MIVRTICFIIGMAMMASTITGYACIRVGAMSEQVETYTRESKRLQMTRTLSSAERRSNE